jgi:hypothetical protein
LAEFRAVALVVFPLTKPKEKLRPPSLASADTAQAPKNIIMKITDATTTMKVIGTGNRRDVNLFTSQAPVGCLFGYFLDIVIDCF